MGWDGGFRAWSQKTIPDILGTGGMNTQNPKWDF